MEISKTTRKLSNNQKILQKHEKHQKNMKNLEKPWKSSKHIKNHKNKLETQFFGFCGLQRAVGVRWACRGVRWACGGRAGACGGDGSQAQISPKIFKKSKTTKNKKNIRKLRFSIENYQNICIFSVFAFSCGINQISWFSLILKGIFICYMILLGK